MITIKLPVVCTDVTDSKCQKVAQDVADVLRGKVSAHLHDAILCELLRQEVMAFSSRADLTVREFIAALSE